MSPNVTVRWKCLGCGVEADDVASRAEHEKVCPSREPPEIQQQPDPVPADGDIWADVLLDVRHGRTVSPELYALMEARRQQGVARYGTPLQIRNLRDARSDAIQEALDAIAYCECRRQQLAPTDPTGALGWSYAREDAERLAQRMLELP